MEDISINSKGILPKYDSGYTNQPVKRIPPRFWLAETDKSPVFLFNPKIKFLDPFVLQKEFSFLVVPTEMGGCMNSERMM